MGVIDEGCATIFHPPVHLPSWYYRYYSKLPPTRHHIDGVISGHSQNGTMRAVWAEIRVFEQALGKGHRQNLIGNPRNRFTVIMAGIGPPGTLRTERIMGTTQLLDRACASSKGSWE